MSGSPLGGLCVTDIEFRVSKHPNYVAPGVPGSGKNWALGCAAYLACFFIWFFGVFVLYELVYSFYRRWRVSKSFYPRIYASQN